MSDSEQQKRFRGNEILRDLIPLNALTDDRFREVIASLRIEDVSAGTYLFGEGDRDNRSIYLLDGVINLIDSTGRVTGAVSAGTDPARYPVANQQPRITTARAATKAVVATLDSTLLDVMLTLDQSTPADAPVIHTRSSEDWMTRMLQSDAFLRMAPADIQRLLKTLEAVPVRSGDAIIRQGDEGDYFYIIKKGSCSVTRLASGDGWDVPLAELSEGDCFGEEALVSDSTRNATINMLTDGVLMRLSKKDFVELMKKQLVHYIDYETASTMVADGGVWLDVRLAEEHANFSLQDSTNVPLASIRDKAAMLDSQQKYIIYCDTGRRSAAAAFLLSQRGLDVCVLEGGFNKSAPPGLSDAGSDQAALENHNQQALGTQAAAGVLSLVALDEEVGEKQAQHTGSGPVSGANEPGLVEIQATLATLQSRFNAYGEIVQRMEAVCAEERAARDTLNSTLAQLLPSHTLDTDSK